MGISKKGSRKIVVDGHTFYWKVRKKVSHEECHDDEYGVPIRHESEGQLLFAYVGYCRSGYPGRESIESITPSIIKSCITQAIELGWQYELPGRPISLVEGKLIDNARVAKWSAG